MDDFRNSYSLTVLIYFMEVYAGGLVPQALET